jgi:hypothetical protein
MDLDSTTVIPTTKPEEVNLCEYTGTWKIEDTR